MIVNGINYPIIGVVKSKKTGEIYPLLDIPMMSDEKWKKMTNTPEQIERRKKLAALIEAGGLNG